MGTIAARTISQHKLNESVLVGKDVLELLSSAMYVNPLCIYREYIQNAADSIDEAQAKGLYSKEVTPRIDISIDVADRSIKIRDNGIGIPANTFSRRLTSLGASQKRGSNARGFRGVGRLSGLAYCQELIFRSKSKSSPRAWEVRWDCRRLKELLNDNKFSGDLNDVMYEIVEFDILEDARSAPHFFEVELTKVKRLKNDILLSERSVGNYLSQVGPAPFAKNFSFGPRITSYLAKYGADSSYQTYLNGSEKPLYRPFKNTFEAKQTLKDRFTELEFFEIPGLNGERHAVGWFLHHSYYGALPDRLGIKGLRLRLGNMQVGDERIFEQAFSEPRFNAWAVGEIHILSQRLMPNGRRDDLEQSVHQQNLINHLMPHTKRIGKLCRRKSSERACARTTENKSRSGVPAPGPGLRSTQLSIESLKCARYLAKVPTSRRKAYEELFQLMLGCRSKKAATTIICEVLPEIARRYGN